MKKKKRYQEPRQYYRCYSCYQEKRMWYAHKDEAHLRYKRSPRSIGDSWGEAKGCVQKTWKVKRKKQYRGRSQKQEFTVILPVTISKWDLEEHFNAANIPFRLEEKKESYYYESSGRRRVKDKYIPVYHYRWLYIDGKMTQQRMHQTGWRWTYKDITTSIRHKVKYSTLTHYVLTYWSNKELNLDFILSFY